MISPDLIAKADSVRGLLARGVAELARAGYGSAVLERALLDLEGPFLLVVAGEFNSGKSSLLNALLGEHFLKEGPTPTTDRVQLISYADSPTQRELADGLYEVGMPHPLLRDLRLVDTPGTNAIVRQHQLLTERFLPRSDLILFVTSSERPFTQSEKEFLELIKTWGKKVAVVVNKIDLLNSEDRKEVMDFVRGAARSTLEVGVPVFAASARQGPEGGALLQGYITQVLQGEAAKIKLGSPLGVLLREAGQASATSAQNLSAVREELARCRELDAILERHQTRMRAEFAGRTALVQGVLAGVESRGERWLDETVRLGRFFDLINSKRVQKSFEDEVVADSQSELELALQEALSWLADRERDLLEDALLLLRQTPPRTPRAGGVMREHIAAARAAYQPGREAEALSLTFQQALQRVALVEVGAVGLGAISVAALHGLVLDVTGVLAGLVVAVLGFSVLPRRKEAARRRLKERIAQMSEGLEAALLATLESELVRSGEDFRNLYREECSKLSEQEADLEARLSALSDLASQAKSLLASL